MFSLYTLLKVSIDPVTHTELVFERVTMFAFPVFASRLVSDATCTTMVAYDHSKEFNQGKEDIRDYY